MKMSSDDSKDMGKCWPQYAPAQLLLNLVKSGQVIEIPAKHVHGTELITKEYTVDANDPGASTEIRLRHIQSNDTPGCYYLNPMYTVSVSELSEQFFDAVHSCSRSWFMHLDRAIHTRGRKAAYRAASEREKCFGYVGILVFNGEAELRTRGVLKVLSDVRRKQKHRNQVGSG